MANIIACETKLKSIKKTHTALESPGVQTATFKNKLDNYLRFQTGHFFLRGGWEESGLRFAPVRFSLCMFYFRDLPTI